MPRFLLLFLLLPFFFISCQEEREPFDPGYTTLAIKALANADSARIDRVTPSGFFADAMKIRTEITVTNCRALHQKETYPALLASAIAHLVYSNYQYSEADSAQEMLVLFSDTLGHTSDYKFPVSTIALVDPLISLTRTYYDELTYQNTAHLERDFDPSLVAENGNGFFAQIGSMAKDSGAGALLLIGYKIVPLETRFGKNDAMMLTTQAMFGTQNFLINWYYDGKSGRYKLAKMEMKRKEV